MHKHAYHNLTGPLLLPEWSIKTVKIQWKPLLRSGLDLKCSRHWKQGSEFFHGQWLFLVGFQLPVSPIVSLVLTVQDSNSRPPAL